MKKSNSWLLALLMPLCLLAACGQPDATKNGVKSFVKAKPAIHPVIVELIVPKNHKFDGDEFSDAKWFSDISAEVSIWKNRITVYALVSDANDLAKYIKESSHLAYDSVKVFDKPFYNFNRSMCADTISSKKWTNIFLTANLVADPKMQQEYLDYHKTQFEKWPEVSKGFCNASFQQLLVFKNGRQLIIVISIPKGESLDKLNPLTTKNNPRVDEWNKTMSKYQEGLPGTKKGESWVFLMPFDSTKFAKDRLKFDEGK